MRSRKPPVPPPPPPPPDDDGLPALIGPAPGPALGDRNVYIPSFISTKPFYTKRDDDDHDAAAADKESGSADFDYLSHQRLRKQEEEGGFHDRTLRSGPAATKYRKGACENCGAGTHKVKDCLERPRATKKSAKWSGRDIKPDDVIQDVRLGWDAKRDRWNGYDAGEYDAVVAEYKTMEALRKQARAMVAAKAKKDEADADEEENQSDSADVDEEGDKYAEENDMSRHQSTATRQLRMREDTAKYLLSLDLDSAKYDPKTRRLINAGGTTTDAAGTRFAEDGFLRDTGEAIGFQQAERLAWEMQERSGDTGLHPQANPTLGEKRRQQVVEERGPEKRAERDMALRQLYGSIGGKVDPGGNVDRKPDDLDNHSFTPLSRQNKSIPSRAPPLEHDTWETYDALGNKKGPGAQSGGSPFKRTPVLLNNHTKPWGSWWHDFKWGFACCYSQSKLSYCVGDKGRDMWHQMEEQRLDRLAPHMELLERGAPSAPLDHAADKKSAADKNASDKNASDKGAVDKNAAGKEEMEKRENKKKRTREDMMGGATEADMEEYHRTRVSANDPMVGLLEKHKGDGKGGKLLARSEK